MKVAVFTLVNNQPEFQEIWIKYYSQFNFHLLILEHVFDEAEEGLVCSEPYEHRKIFHAELFDHKFMSDITHDTQKELLKQYETVIYTDIDELIIPKHCSLEEYCENNTEDIVQCTGYNLVDGRMVAALNFNKPLITKVPVTWCPGWHICEEDSVKDLDLWLVHIHRMDYEIAKKHWEARRLTKVNKYAKKTKMSWMNYCELESEFKKWYCSDDDKKEDIPQWLKDKLKEIL